MYKSSKNIFNLKQVFNPHLPTSPLSNYQVATLVVAQNCLKFELQYHLWVASFQKFSCMYVLRSHFCPTEPQAGSKWMSFHSRSIAEVVYCSISEVINDSLRSTSCFYKFVLCAGSSQRMRVMPCLLALLPGAGCYPADSGPLKSFVKSSL